MITFYNWKDLSVDLIQSTPVVHKKAQGHYISFS